MPKRNRVTPFGAIIVTSARGGFMGNRGILHNERQAIERPYRLKAWIICKLAFKGRKLPIMAPGHYTQLFFLDEATALAAGHRPCFECRRDHALAFRAAWVAANPNHGSDPKIPIRHIDAVLHHERLTEDRYIRHKRKQTYTAVVDALPNGTFIAEGETAFLVWDDALFPWTPAGYGVGRKRPFGQTITVLTPPSTVGALAHGYVPVVGLVAR